MEKLEIVIVGAGLSGLAASIQCALSGHNTTVLEGAKELAEVHLTPFCPCIASYTMSRSAQVSS
jgi:salicylate hydroxylase